MTTSYWPDPRHGGFSGPTTLSPYPRRPFSSLFVINLNELFFLRRLPPSLRWLSRLPSFLRLCQLTKRSACWLISYSLFLLHGLVSKSGECRGRLMEDSRNRLSWGSLFLSTPSSSLVLRLLGATRYVYARLFRAQDRVFWAKRCKTLKGRIIEPGKQNYFLYF